MIGMTMAVVLAGWFSTSPDDCWAENKMAAHGEWSAMLIRVSCNFAYGDNVAPDDQAFGKCVLDRIEEPTSEYAFRLLAADCRANAANR